MVPENLPFASTAISGIIAVPSTPCSSIGTTLILDSGIVSTEIVVPLTEVTWLIFAVKWIIFFLIVNVFSLTKPFVGFLTDTTTS